MPQPRRLVGALASIVLAGLLLPLSAAPVAAESGATVPTGFRDKVVWSGISDPTVVAFAPNGKVFVAQKNGRILVFDSLTDPTPTQFADLSDDVYNYWDRGLLGFAVDPQFPSRPYVYALYAYNHILGEGGSAPRWGNNSSVSDPCPGTSLGGPGPTTDGCVASGRLERLTLNAAVTAVTARKVLVEDWCQQFPSHSTGSLAFDQDGYLLASAGDGASFIGADYGQLGGTQPNPDSPITPRNPCGDPWVDDDPSTPAVDESQSSQGGAFRSQDLLTSGDPTTLDGTIIRIHPDTGAPDPNNYNFGSGDTNKQRIIAYGMRNPFRITVRSDGKIWLGDVGFADWEEIDKISNPDAAPVNFGWPCYEGVGQLSTYQYIDSSMCDIQGPVTPPVFTYAHTANVLAGDGCDPGSSAIAGLAFRGTAGPYPTSYDHGLFFTDYSRQCIWFAPATATGDPNFGAIKKFADLRRASDVDGGAVYLGVTPAGDVIYTDLDRDEVRQIKYESNLPPTATFSASPTAGVAPLHVNFNASSSSDPNGDALEYAWDLDGDGAYDDATGVTASRTYTAAGDVVVRLRVTDSDGLTDTAFKTISPGNSPPSATIVDPSSSVTWAVGDTIDFAGTATDAQDGALPASAYEWTLAIEHCPSNCHEHVTETFSGVPSGSFDAPNHDYPTHLQLRLTVTDSGGLKNTVARDIQPKTGTVSGVSSPAGISLSVGSGSGAPPPTVTWIVGSTVDVSATTTATLGEVGFTFDQWSDGGSRTHAVSVASGATRLTAEYAQTSVTDATNTCSGAPVGATSSVWKDGWLQSGTDVDWYRFTTTSTRTVAISLADLPAAASLKLYKGCSTLLATSDRSGTHTEEIFRSLAKGTYAVKITSKGSSSVDPYAFRIRRLSSRLSVLSATSQVDETAGTLTLVGEVWNEYATTRGPITVTAKLLDADGNLLTTRTAKTQVYAVSEARVPFRISGSLPDGFAEATYSASGSKATKTLRGVSKDTTSFQEEDGRWRAKGTIKATKGAISGLKTVLTLYDRRGAVIDVVPGSVGKTSLSKNKSTSYSTWSKIADLDIDRGKVRALAFKR